MPQIATATDVVISPYNKQWVGGPDIGRAPDYCRIRNVIRGGFFDSQADYDAESVTTSAGTYLYGGWFKAHFGHVMTDTIHRLWAYNRNLHSGGVILAGFNGAAAPTPALVEAAAYFGVPAEALVIVTAPRRFQEVHFVEAGSSLAVGPASWYVPFLRDVASSVLAGRAECSKKLFIGRDHILRAGTLAGERYFMDILLRNGFTYFRPEAVSVGEQAATIAQAEVVVFTEGSAIYASELLDRIEARVFMIPRRPNPIHFAPHLAARGEFAVLGDPKRVVRLPDSIGRISPSSLSVTTSPEGIYADMVSAGLVPDEPFDTSLFNSLEMEAATSYYGCADKACAAMSQRGAK